MLNEGKRETWYEVEWGEVRPIVVLRQTAKMVTYLHDGGATYRKKKPKHFYRTEAEADAAMETILSDIISHYRLGLTAAEAQRDALLAKRYGGQNATQ